MKTLFLIPPSEGKNTGGVDISTRHNSRFSLPLDIALHATEKDLKCTGDRYTEGIELNTHIQISPTLPAIERYSGVMFDAIDYTEMSPLAQKFFNNNFAILSGMYGLVFPQENITNYKLPIETKGLVKFWGSQITEYINEQQYDVVIDLLPKSYQKMIQWDQLNAKRIQVQFLTEKNGKTVLMAHGVKKVKGQWIHNVCEQGNLDCTQCEGSIQIRS